MESNEMFNGNGLWIFALIILLLIGGGGIGGIGGNSTNTLERAIDLNTIQQGQTAINNDVQRIGYENMAVTKDSAYNNLSEIRDNGMMMSTGFANLQNCCCETLRAIDGAKYDNALGVASINSNIDNKFASLEKSMLEQKIAEQGQQINQLQMAQALCGIPKISTYAWGTYPYNNNCGCGNI